MSRLYLSITIFVSISLSCFSVNNGDKTPAQQDPEKLPSYSYADLLSDESTYVTELDKMQESGLITIDDIRKHLVQDQKLVEKTVSENLKSKFGDIKNSSDAFIALCIILYRYDLENKLLFKKKNLDGEMMTMINNMKKTILFKKNNENHSIKESLKRLTNNLKKLALALTG